MAGFRAQMLYGLRWVSAQVSTTKLLKMSKQNAILPFYHTISDDELPHIKHLYKTKNTRAFEQDLDYLLQYFDAVNFEDFWSIQLGQRQSAKPVFLLSFDDGLREFHDVVAPILRSKGIPAICFLNSQFVDNKDLFYRYKASLLIDFIENDATNIQKACAFFDNHIHWRNAVLNVNYRHKSQLDNLAKLVELSYEDFLQTTKPYLTSHQIIALQKQGFEFGGHSIDHPEYQYISLGDQLNQTEKSIEFVTDNFMEKHKLFSFPFTDFGVSRTFFEKVKNENIAKATFGCAGQKQEQFQNHFQRIPFEMNDLSAKQILNAELIYFLMRKPFGKNVITRHDYI